MIEIVHKDTMTPICDLELDTLAGANLGGLHLPCALLWSKDMERANLAGAKLPEANLDRANLQNTDLSNANLRLASLQDADLRGANLRGASLEGADLRGADLRGANLRDTILYSARFDRNTRWPLLFFAPSKRGAVLID